MMTGLRVIVCDRHPIIRGAFAAYLETQPRIALATAVDNGEEAVSGALRGADVLVLGLRLAGEVTAVDVIEALRNRGIAIPVLVIGDVRELDLVARALTVGGLGYLPTTAAPPDLFEAVCQVAAGHAYVPEALVDPLLRRLRTEVRVADDAQRMFERLTSRERQVLHHLGQGLSRHEIARRLGVSSNTVRTHVRHVMGKLGVTTQLAAAARGRELFDVVHSTRDDAVGPPSAVDVFSS